MTRNEIFQIENICTIKTESEFMAKCNALGIDSSWYSLTGENAIVTLNGNSIQGMGSIVNCPVRMIAYDIMLGRLLKYKEQFEFEQSDRSFRISDLYVETWYSMLKEKEHSFPMVRVVRYTSTGKVESMLLEDGWEPGNFSRGDGTISYTKLIPIHENMISLQFRFSKKTDQRDVDTFQFTEPILTGGFSYPIPSNLMEPLAKEIWKNVGYTYCFNNTGDISAFLQKKLFNACATHIMDDEYYELIYLKNEHRKALLDSINPTLSDASQLRIFARIARFFERENRAYTNIYGSRSHIVLTQNYKSVCDSLGIKIKKTGLMK